MTRPAVIGRRPFLTGVLAAAIWRPASAAEEAAGKPAVAAGSAQEAPGTWRQALTLLGNPKYGTDFKHFEYASPDAPKGGLVRFGAQGGFDNFNLIINGLKGDLENGIPQIYDTLMEDSQDEPFTSYGLLAEGVKISEDGRSATYRLREGARWHDGKPITVEDVIWSFETLKANSPSLSYYYQSVTKAEATGEREVTFRFAEGGNRELPQIIGQLQVLPKHWWTGKDASGKPRNPAETTLEIPLGSGPYRLARFDAGRSSTYERVADYWGKDLPVNVGRNNFGQLRFEYFRDANVLIEALKGDRYDFRTENVAAYWATSYKGFPAVDEGRLVKEEFPSRGTGIMQAFVFNLRRDKFKDERVRRAFNLAMNFEEMNRQLFYGSYKRIDSYFFGSELASSDLPEGREKEILEGLKDKVPASVFTTPYANPVNDTPEAVRANLREAVKLLREAGYELKGGQQVDRSGNPLTVEFIEFQSVFERVVLPFARQLELIGIKSSLRVIDTAQYQNRMRTFDFDITTNNWAESLSPGNEQRDFWGSAAASRDGSRNIAGIKDAAIDALIEQVIAAHDRDTQIASVHALDRVLLAHNFVVPQWSSAVVRTIRWNRFSHPETLPKYGASGWPTTWWYDEAKAAKTGAPR